MGRLWVLTLGAFALGTDLFVIAGILPSVARDMGVTPGASGWLMSAFAFTYALAAPILAVATGHLERRRVLLGSFALFCAANVVSATAPDFAVLLASRVFAALGAALYMPSASALAVSLAPPERRGRALSMVTGGLTVAIVLGVPIGTWIGAYADWRATFWFVALVGTGALVGIRIRIPPVPASPPVTWSARIALLRQPRVLAALALTVLSLAGSFVIYPYLATLLARLTHFSATQIGWVLLLFGVASMVGNFLGGYGADRWGATPTLVVALGVFSTVLAAFAWSATQPAMLLIAIAAWGASAWMVTPPQQHRLVAFAPQIPGAVLGLNSSAIYLGMGVGTSIGAMAIQRPSVESFSWAGAAFELAAMLLLFASIILNRTGRGSRG